jgi:hypothetical protein
MARVDGSKVEVHVFTFKEGLLSAVAHDLQLVVERCSVDVEGERILGTFETGSVRVVTAMKNGAPSSALLSPMKAEIEKNIVVDVLEARRFPEARFETTRVTATTIEGELWLHGTTRRLTGSLRNEGPVRVAEFTFDQRDFGITPYSAMLGTLKIKPEVRVTVRLSA